MLESVFVFIFLGRKKTYACVSFAVHPKNSQCFKLEKVCNFEYYERDPQELQCARLKRFSDDHFRKSFKSHEKTQCFLHGNSMKILANKTYFYYFALSISLLLNFKVSFRKNISICYCIE